MSTETATLAPAQLPAISVHSTHGNIDLRNLHGQTVVLYFYPKDATPGCTTQARDFRDLADQFAALNVKILGISRDSLKSHDKFSANECLPFALISDADERLCGYFDVIKSKNMYGKVVQGIERSTFVYGANGQLLQAWRKVKAAGHAGALLAYLTAHLPRANTAD